MLKSYLLPLDYFALLKEAKKQNLDGAPKIKVAFLADCATQHLQVILRALLGRAAVDATVYEAPFGNIELEVFDPHSELYRFAPDFIVILQSTQALKEAYFHAEAKAAFASEVNERTLTLWRALGERTSAIVIQSTYVEPGERFFGNYDHKREGSLGDAVRTINYRLGQESRAFKSVFINDVNYVASNVGRRTWFDDRLWAIAKVLCALDHLPALAQNIVAIVQASRGVAAKCLVLDLDNTLWGGVIGDDGLEGIELGHGGTGEPFLALQSYVRELKRRGVLLAVCSKNTFENAVLPFREHPEMVLQESDITLFVANFEPKSSNIAYIKETLNIGYDSIVFLDDNPFERNLVREMLPDVVVPELPDDPASYVRTIAELNLFEVNGYSELDASRTALYQQAAERDAIKRSYANIDEYLIGLDMNIVVAPYTEQQLPRVAQLIQRSNQFNLATRRFSEAECALFRGRDDRLALAVSLRDRFGDYGLISVIIGRIGSTTLFIEEYLMSCRVLQRGVEHFAMNDIVTFARNRGLTHIQGEYRRTPKNAMVREFYAQFGFQRTCETDSGGSTWLLEAAQYAPKRALIQREPGSSSIVDV